MSDNSVTIVDVEVSKRNAKAAAGRVIEFLAQSRIIKRRATKCVMEMDAKGYAPGPRYSEACVQADPHGLELAVNGLEICIGREVFTGYSNGLEILCPKCSYEVREPDEAWIEAVGLWHQGDDAVTYACPKCRTRQRLAEWDGPWPWGFGSLGFIFWNWPRLKPGFVKEVAGVLGHQVRVVCAHL